MRCSGDQKFGLPAEFTPSTAHFGKPRPDSVVDCHQLSSSSVWRYLRCDEWAAGVHSRGDEVDELALVLTVDLTVELREPVGVSLQGSESLRVSETHTHAHTEHM